MRRALRQCRIYSPRGTRPGLAGGFLFLCVYASANAQTCQPGELRVLVKDSQEAAIYVARVRVGSDDLEVATLSTPASGLAEFEQVPCGAWTVKASKEGFEDSIATIEITDQSEAVE